MEAKGLLLSFEQRRAEDGGIAAAAIAGPPSIRLTAEQEESARAICDAIRSRRYLAALLQGVTGSGKTEVYLQGIAAALEAGRGAIWLVPEIALTPVFARRLQHRFGPRAAVLHSALSERERGLAWERVAGGEAKVVIGPRSAAFAPVADPGLFVVDEEHDASYKQRESPRYDAREVVAIRARAGDAALLFGSATPSLEAYHAAREGRLTLLRLSARVEARPLPEVAIVDLKREKALPEEKGVPLFSAPLVERLRRGLRGGGAGHPSPAAPRVRSVPHLPRLRLRLPLFAVQCDAHRARPREIARLPLLRPARAASGAMSRVRRRVARGDRRRY